MASATLCLNTKTNMAMKWKLKSENQLRCSHIPYVIIRPDVLVDDEIPGKYVEFSQGDTILGNKTSRVDVARVALECIDRVDVKFVTFEMANTGAKKTDFKKEFASLRADSGVDIQRNHDLPIYLLYFVVLYFIYRLAQWILNF